MNNIDIERWKEEFFSSNKDKDSEHNATVNNFVNQKNRNEELELLELMNPDAFDRIPIIYEEKDSKYIDDNWRETRDQLTKDYLKKFKLANRKSKNKKMN